MDPSSGDRRGFLNYLLGAGALASLGAIFYPVIRFMIPPKVVESSASSVVACKVSEIKPNTGKIFKFGSSRQPQVSQRGPRPQPNSHQQSALTKSEEPVRTGLQTRPMRF